MKQAGEHMQRVERADDRAARRSDRLVVWTASVAFILVSLMSSAGVAKYRFSFVFLIPILWAVYGLRRRLSIGRSTSHFSLSRSCCTTWEHSARILERHRAAVRLVVHFFFGLVGALIVARALEAQLGVRGVGLGLLVVLVITGIGGVHEIVEAASTRYLGKDLGMLYIGADNPYDTQEDLLANVLGACVALALHRFRA